MFQPGEVGRVEWVEWVSEMARMGRERSMKVIIHQMNNIIPGEVGRVGWVESVSEMAMMWRERLMTERAARKVLSHLCRPENEKPK